MAPSDNDPSSTNKNYVVKHGMTDLIDPTQESRLATRLRDLLPQLTKSEARIAQYLLLNEANLAIETGASLAAKADVSEITVSRFLRRIGYKGIAALKEDLQSVRLEDAYGNKERALNLLAGNMSRIITKEAEAIVSLAAQLARPEWSKAVAHLGTADEVYVTGFQTIRGLAEDFARRLAITRDTVRFIAAHETGLSEWIGLSGAPSRSRVLILIDIVPYAREAAPLANLCRKLGVKLIVMTDELNSWAYDETPYVFHASTKVGTFLESTGPLATLLNLMVHAVASSDPDRTRDRIDAWPRLFRHLDIY